MAEHPSIVSPGYSNTVEDQENDIKYKLMQIVEAFEEEINPLEKLEKYNKENN